MVDLWLCAMQDRFNGFKRKHTIQTREKIAGKRRPAVIRRNMK